MKKHRNTIQRTTILEELRKLKTHPTAEALYRIVKKKIPSISLGTVYRNLNLLRDEGRVLELTYGKDKSHYDGDVSNHIHFYCLKCKNIYDLPISNIKLSYRVAKGLGFHINSYRIDFYGYCEKCERR